jgi:hypothetical protein
VETRWGWESDGTGGVGKGGGLGMPFDCCLRGSFGTISQELERQESQECDAYLGAAS